ncbi:DUF5947 family protein [Kitasatospora sp. NPDC001175]|uniref:DUF5947 family protein n=1 Tax=Kitasatospora sp. NPDC001175 TaxID=3157103 RepID=UPI003D01CBFA
MNARPISRPGSALLRRLREPAPPQPERCGFCGVRLPSGHRHVVDTDDRALACTCPACAMLFETPGAAEGRYRKVPDRYLMDPAHELGRSDWESLQIPVSTAFFFRNTALRRLIALYPSPAGPTESELDPQTWEFTLGRTRLAGLLEPDVEALLLRRTTEGLQYFLVPIDVCYELVGRMRLHWQGFDGGSRARAELDSFFARVEQRARVLAQEVAS